VGDHFSRSPKNEIACVIFAYAAQSSIDAVHVFESWPIGSYMKRDLLALLMRDEDPSLAALARSVSCARREEHLFLCGARSCAWSAHAPAYAAVSD
jgi:hypothetical protein